MEKKNFIRRLGKFWELAPKKNVIYLISCPADIFYLIGIEPERNVFLTVGPSKNELNLYCPQLFADDFFKKLPAVVKVNNFLPDEQYFRQKNLPVAVNPKNVSGDFLLRLKKILGKKLCFYDFTDAWRMVKEIREIQKISQAGKIIANLLEEIYPLIRRRVTEREISGEIVRRLKKFGVEPAFEPIVAFGKNTAFPHHRSGNTRFSGKGPVLIDAGCRYQGYCSDITRTYYFGPMSPLFLKVYQTVAQAKIAAEKAVAVGKKFSEIDRISRRLIEDSGFGKSFVHGIGHGVGIEIHELPELKRDAVLKENMVFTIEPGIYLPGKFGVRLEDTVLLTKKGIKILTAVSGNCYNKLVIK